MILSDREIKAALARGAIALTPFPGKQAWSSTAVDLRLASEIILWKTPSGGAAPLTVAPAQPEFNFQQWLMQHGERVDISRDGFLFRTQSFFLGWTLERLKLPFRSRIAARVEGKSRLARLGLGIHVTAPTIHSGFGHKLTDDSYPGNSLQLEIWNVGPFDLQLQAEMAICQLIFEWVDGTPERGYEGQFAEQGPAANV